MNQVKVLVVEDHDIAQKVEVRILTGIGCLVDAASDGNAALELLNQNNYDLVFMDIGLPDMDGLALAETIRHSENQNKAVPIIALTAYADEGYKNRATWVGMNDFIVKPLTAENSQKAIKKFHKNT